MENTNSIWDGMPLKHLVECIRVKTDSEKLDVSCIAGGDVKWYSHFGRHFDHLLQS